jgi:hypothetical protein
LAEKPSIENSDHSFAVVTKTFYLDLTRCELLAESLDRNAPQVPHYLIVDRCDRAAFSHLNSGKRIVIESEALLGGFIFSRAGRKGFWLRSEEPPLNGWIVQQILKIGAIEAIPERTLIFCDSDVAFFRGFNRDNLLVDGKMGLLDVDFNDEMSRRWTTTARRLLGIKAYDGGYRTHIGSMVCWHREIVKTMQRQIETCAGMDWRLALARTPTFSEYMIYGIFVREMLGYDVVDHAPSAVPLVKPSWGIALTSISAMDAFFADFDPRTVAVMIHSKDAIDPARYRPHLERLWGRQ